MGWFPLWRLDLVTASREPGLRLVDVQRGQDGGGCCAARGSSWQNRPTVGNDPRHRHPENPASWTLRGVFAFWGRGWHRSSTVSPRQGRSEGLGPSEAGRAPARGVSPLCVVSETLPGVNEVSGARHGSRSRGGSAMFSPPMSLQCASDGQNMQRLLHGYVHNMCVFRMRTFVCGIESHVSLLRPRGRVTEPPAPRLPVAACATQRASSADRRRYAPRDELEEQRARSTMGRVPSPLALKAWTT